MTRDAVLLKLARGLDPALVGSKAANLVFLASQGLRVPEAHVIPWPVQMRFESESDHVDSDLARELAAIALPGRSYAVRSSAAVEDGLVHSYAGQFASVLDVRGLDALINAVKEVWASSRAAAVRNYRSPERGSATEEGGSVKMSVIVQDMVTPVVSGVVFSRNPVTGMREVVIEAVGGPGTLLLQDGVTPARWVHRGGQFATEPAEQVLGTEVATEVVREAKRLAAALKADLDLEFVWDGTALHWLQMRRITAMPRPQIYSSRISREMLAGLIKPLIWSINIPMINGVWIGLLTEVIGPNKLRPEDLAKQFHYRAYFNMGLLGEVFEDIGIPAESLEVMWGLSPAGAGRHSLGMGKATMRLLPRLLRFAWTKWSVAARLERQVPELEASFRALTPETFADLSEDELIAEYARLRLLLERAAYLNVVGPLSAILYNHLLRRELARAGVDYATLDLGQDRPEMERFVPRHALLQLKRQYQTSPSASLADAMQRVLSDFGHMSENGNDFSAVQWRENPQAVLELALAQPDSVKRPDTLLKLDQVDLRGARPWLVRMLYRRARAFNLYREHISYVYTMGYSRLRPIFKGLGKHLASRGLLSNEEDVFFLTVDEVKQGISADCEPARLKELVASRQAELEAARHVVLPDLIYGDQPPPLPVRHAGRLAGTATSRGYCQGPACVIAGLQDFGKMRDGDVLVIPYSDVSWTPLFGRAAGVVAESGGMLSHSSIVAREYGIPAVVSVAGAMQIADRAVIRVDGYAGEVLVLDGAEPPAAGGEGELGDTRCF